MKDFKFFKKENIEIIFILIIVLIGLLVRLIDLGKWQLATDEYYLVKSAQNILKYGFPMWDVGGFYSRGLIIQYFIALLILIGIKVEFASRILSVISNIISIPALYFLSKKIIPNKLFRISFIFLFTFSLWEVEFSRFARMYSMFQAIFIWYIFFLYKYIFEDDHKSYYKMIILTLISVFVYEGSIFLALLNFYPIIWKFSKRKLNENKNEMSLESRREILLFIIVLAITIFYLKFDFRTLYRNDVLPLDVVGYYKNMNVHSFIRIPKLLLFTIYENTIWTYLFFTLITVNFYLLYYALKTEERIEIKIVTFIAFILSILNLIGLGIILLILTILLNVINIKLNIIKSYKNIINNNKCCKHYSTYILFIYVINFIFWNIYILFSDTWQKLYLSIKLSSIFNKIKLINKEALNFPNLYESFALFKHTIPITTIFSITSIFILSLMCIYKNNNQIFQKYRFLLILILTLLLAQNFINLVYFETRYFFFIYPLILFVLLSAIYEISNFVTKQQKIANILMLTLLLIFINFSEDFKFKQLISINTKVVNFRINFDKPLAVHYYPRWDSKSAAEIINKKAEKNDLIITNEYTSEYYLKRLDYFLNDYRWANFPTEAALNGTKDRWTGASLIYKYEDLEKTLTNNNKNIWLILNTSWALDELNSLVYKYKSNLIYKSADGNILLFQIPSKNI